MIQFEFLNFDLNLYIVDNSFKAYKSKHEK